MTPPLRLFPKKHPNWGTRAALLKPLVKVAMIIMMVIFIMMMTKLTKKYTNIMTFD